MKIYAHMWQLITVSAGTRSINWPKDLQKYNIYTNEEGIYELLFSSQPPKAKAPAKDKYHGWP